MSNPTQPIMAKAINSIIQTILLIIIISYTILCKVISIENYTHTNCGLFNHTIQHPYCGLFGHTIQQREWAALSDCSRKLVGIQFFTVH